jgi:hypothetical protein
MGFSVGQLERGDSKRKLGDLKIRSSNGRFKLLRCKGNDGSTITFDVIAESCERWVLAAALTTKGEE